jgi:microcystin-dependent protein
MSQPFIGEIRCFGFQFAPASWAFCDGQLMAIDQNPALYSILGTTFGGNGTTTFGLPNLQGAAPMHWGNGPGGFNTTIGQPLGTPMVTVTIAQTPAHAHTITAQELGSGGVVERTATPNPNAWLSDSSPGGVYNYTPTINAPFSPSALTSVGGSSPHENMQPYLAVNFCICLNGVFPSRN